MNMAAHLVALLLSALVIGFPRRILRWKLPARELAVALLLSVSAAIYDDSGAATLVFGAVLLGASEARR